MENMSAQQHCPLCQQVNDCAMTEAGNTASHCWCMHVKINPEALAQLNAAQKNIACICQKCAAALKA